MTKDTGARSRGGGNMASRSRLPDAATMPSSTVAIMSEEATTLGTACICGRLSAMRRRWPCAASTASTWPKRSPRVDEQVRQAEKGRQVERLPCGGMIAAQDADEAILEQRSRQDAGARALTCRHPDRQVRLARIEQRNCIVAGGCRR